MRLRYNPHMRKVDEILQTAKKLKRAQIERLIEKLDEHLEALDEKKFARTKGPLYAGTLALAGSARSDYEDVSTNKNKHLAEIYATKNGR
jgi:hypothetical protein